MKRSITLAPTLPLLPCFYSPRVSPLGGMGWSGGGEALCALLTTAVFCACRDVYVLLSCISQSLTGVCKVVCVRELLGIM